MTEPAVRALLPLAALPMVALSLAAEEPAAPAVPASEPLQRYIRGGDFPEGYELVELSMDELPDLSRPVEAMREQIREGLRDAPAGRLFRRVRRGWRRNRGGGEGAETGAEGESGAEEGGGGSEEASDGGRL